MLVLFNFPPILKHKTWIVPTSLGASNKGKHFAAPIKYGKFEKEVLAYLKSKHACHLHFKHPICLICFIFLLIGMKRYIRTQARNIEDIKNEQRDQRNIIRDLQAEVKRLSSRPRSSTPDLTQDESRHPAFDPFFSILSSMTEFNAFEQMILVPENRKKMVFGFSFELLCYFHF